MLKQLRILALLLLQFPMFFGLAVNAQDATAFKASDKENTLNQEETLLFNLINDLRITNKLSAIPLSADLCLVAQTHINDLLVSKPQESGCSLHSWSNAGKWSPCCHSKDPSGLQCMKSKPKEITGYTGNGFELIYWGEDMATASEATDLWKKVEASMDMLLCKGKWKTYQWKAMGVGIKEGYAILWLGDKADANQITQDIKPDQSVTKEEANQLLPVSNSSNTEKAVKPQSVTGSSTVNEPNSDNQVKYYLVVASVKTQAGAQTELKRVKAKGYSSAYILPGESVYRIVVNSFSTSKQANKGLSNLRSDFPDVWILKK